MTLSLSNLIHFADNILLNLGCKYDPKLDVNGLPVVSRAIVSAPKPEIKVDKMQYVIKDNTLYVKRMVKDDYGNMVPEWDSKDPVLRTDRNENLTKYDKEILDKYKSDHPESNDYKYLKIEKYAVIKKYGWSKAKNENTMIGYRAAGDVPEIAALSGCGKRRRATYYKLMNEAFMNELNDKQAPIERS